MLNIHIHFIAIIVVLIFLISGMCLLFFTRTSIEVMLGVYSENSWVHKMYSNILVPWALKIIGLAFILIALFLIIGTAIGFTSWY